MCVFLTIVNHGKNIFFDKNVKEEKKICVTLILLHYHIGLKRLRFPFLRSSKQKAQAFVKAPGIEISLKEKRTREYEWPRNNRNNNRHML